MPIITGIFYGISFLAVYVQVFLLVTFFENRKKIIIRKKEITLQEYPSVTIIIPCYNEQYTVVNTIESLLALEYPEDKLHIIAVDNASKDDTFEVLKAYASNSRIRVFREEKVGKHNALNTGLANLQTEFVGCLDADSTVHPEALKRIMSYFAANKDTMAVAPSIVVRDPKNILQ